jgi:hypothetical protein
MAGRRFLAGFPAGLALFVAACSGSSEPGSDSTDPPAAAVSVDPAAGATEIDPLSPVQVTTSDGKLTSVTMTNEQGRTVEGVFTPDQNARWFYDFSQPGDVVEIRNTGGAPLEVWQNGDWSVPWEQWQAGSALR